MARIRTIKPEFFLNDEIAELCPLDRLLFIGLWTQADREGRFEDRNKKIKASILPYDDHDINSALDRLQGKKFILRYSDKDCNYIQINNFLKHQYPNIKERESTIPAPCKHHTSIHHSGKERKGKESSGYSSEVLRLSDLLLSLIQANNPKAKKSDPRKWDYDIAMLEKLDGQPIEDIEAVLRWSQSDSFWKSNILSGKKLREKWNQLTAKMQTEKPLEQKYAPIPEFYKLLTPEEQAGCQGITQGDWSPEKQLQFIKNLIASRERRVKEREEQEERLRNLSLEYEARHEG